MTKTVSVTENFSKSMNLRQFEASWDMLCNVSGPNVKVYDDPIQLVKDYLMTAFDLANDSAGTRARVIVNELLNRNVMSVVRNPQGEVRTKPAIISFDISSRSHSPFAESTPSPTTMKSRIEHMNTSTIPRVIKKSEASDNGAKTNGNNGHATTIAIWIDTPNLTRACSDYNVEIPLEGILEKICVMGIVVLPVALINSGCPQYLKEVFSSFNFWVVDCPPTKPWEIVHDPIDAEIDRRVREKLASMIDHHVIISGDKNFSPLISYLRMQGKKATRFQMDNHRPILRMGAGEDTEYITCTPKRYKNFSSHNRA